MTAVSVAFDGTRLSAAESDTDGGTWDKWGATQTPTQEVDFVYQGSTCQSNKISNGTGGVDFDSTGTTDLSTTPRAVIAVVNVTTYGLIDTAVHKGTAYQIGSSGSDYYEYYIHGSEKDYPARGGFIILAIDPNVACYRSATAGTPALGSADYYGWWADITAIVKSENVMHDSLSYVDSGSGLTLTGGDGSDADGKFSDFVDTDQGDPTSGRWGIVTEVEGIISIRGTITIGTATATVFADSKRAMVFTDSLTDRGFNGIAVGMSNASSNIQVEDCFFQGEGRGIAKNFFDSVSDVDGTNDVITLDATKPWRNLDCVTYSDEGGSDNIGLTDGTSYWIYFDVANNGWAFYTSQTNAVSDTSRVGLTAGVSGGEQHSVDLDNDTRPDFTVTGTTGVQALFAGCVFDSFRNFTLTSKAELNACKIVGADLITQDGGTLDGCTMSGATTDDGVALVVADDIGLIKDCDFTHSDGHAIEVAPTGAGPYTYTFDGNSFNGYGANDTSDAALLINPTASPSPDITINVQNGSTPTFILDPGYDGTFTMAQTVTVSINCKDAGDSSNIDGARILLEADTGGDLPADESVTITRSGSTATVSHNAHGLATNDEVVIRGAVGDEYNGIHTITVTTTNEYTYTVSGSPATPDVGDTRSTAVVLNGLTNVSGILQDTGFNYTTDQPVTGIARRGTSSPFYKTAGIAGTITNTGFSTTTFMVSDE